MQYITNRMIIKHLQGLAYQVYYIIDAKLLKLWSPHSIRVRACILLYVVGKDSSFIQLRLQWRSLAFIDYLRNTITLAKQYVITANKDLN